MSLCSEELQQELVWVGVTHSALKSVVREAVAKLVFMIYLFLSCYTFNKQEPWYFSCLNTVEDSMEEMLVTKQE